MCSSVTRAGRVGHQLWVPATATIPTHKESLQCQGSLSLPLPGHSDSPVSSSMSGRLGVSGLGRLRR